MSKKYQSFPFQIYNFFIKDGKLPEDPRYLKANDDDSAEVKKFKRDFYFLVQKCWTLDSEERPQPDALIKSFIGCMNDNSKFN